jgi:hypothetical protein
MDLQEYRICCASAAGNYRDASGLSREANPVFLPIYLAVVFETIHSTNEISEER